MFSLYGQLCRLRAGDNTLAHQARAIFSSSCSSLKSWFWKDSCASNIPSPTPLNGFFTNPPSTRLRSWPSQQGSSVPRLTTSPPSSTCRPTFWGSPPAILCSDYVAALHVRLRKLPVKHDFCLGDTGLRPCQAIGLLDPLNLTMDVELHPLTLLGLKAGPCEPHRGHSTLPNHNKQPENRISKYGL